MSEASDEISSRYLIGIDLGTTNSALAYVDTSQKKWVVRDFAIPQLVAPATVEARQTLPSFHYEAAAAEFPAGALRLPWSKDDPRHAIGFFARDHGALAPGRLVASAKSWLSHSGVDRTAGLLPWHGAGDVELLSPVEVSARILSHLRDAWDQAYPEHPMGEQDIVLAVPASFDEVARELTIEAARRAGLVHVVLVEEPQAAFYAWINAQGARWEQRVKPGQKILVCDIGGGTSDFTLIEARSGTGAKILFHRVAVGEHLILGGDNLDLALAQHVEQKLGRPLEPHRWGALVRSVRHAKETLLGEDAPQHVMVNASSGGSKLIGGAVQVEITREDAMRVLVEGFLPRVSLVQKPLNRRSGFQEFGLPYAPDAAITRYLAAFLNAHGGSSPSGQANAARPDLVLFNGGFFESPVLRERLLEVLSAWFGEADGKWKPQVLKSERLDLAVSRGAAYYAMVRRGHGVRISGGLAHSYYLGIDPPGDEAGPVAICLLPAGVEEGETVELADKTFNLLIRQPVEFPLYASSTRTNDRPGLMLRADPDQMTPLPPIRTVLQSGKQTAAQSVRVHLHARLTPIGTLDIWCAEIAGERTWRLQFDIRAAARADATRHNPIGEAAGVLDERVAQAGREQIRAVFSGRTGELAVPVQSLVKALEEMIAVGRADWPPTLLRAYWEALLEARDGRRLSDIHEARWLNFTGFCLRPGYGLAADDWRVGRTWKLLPEGVLHPKNEAVRAEWWILWRRVAGGMSAGQQRTVADPLIADWRAYLRKSGSNVRGRSPEFQFGPHESAEVWRLLGSLELLAVSLKLEIGSVILQRLAREKAANARAALFFALGRIGARVPAYGPLNGLVAAETATEWARHIMTTPAGDEKAAFALMQLCRRTDDRYRDVSPPTRDAAAHWLIENAAPPHLVELVREGGRLADAEQGAVFGESLPRGLRIE